MMVITNLEQNKKSISFGLIEYNILSKYDIIRLLEVLGNFAYSIVCAKALVDVWISRFGVLLDMTSDRGAQFTSATCNHVAYNMLGVLNSIVPLYFWPCSPGPKCLRESSLQVRIIVYTCFISSLPLVSFRGLD